MSDAVAAAPEAPPIPNYSAAPKTATINGVAEQLIVVKYGQNAANSELPERVLEVRRCDMGDQFDLAEIAGAQVDNDVWLSLAMVALSVQTIDGTPVPRGNVSKANLRTTLKNIGPLGVRAVRRALYEMSGADGAPAADHEKKAPGI